jgi:hypothetical protein
MKKLLFVFVLGAFAACGGGDSTATTDSTTVTSGSMSTDTTSTMSADTSSMSTPH